MKPQRLHPAFWVTILMLCCSTQAVLAQDRGLTHRGDIQLEDDGLSNIALAPKARVALLIGSGGMKNALEEVGFEVVVARNDSKQTIKAGLDAFRDKLSPGGVAMVIYSGEGLQYQGRNWLLPKHNEIKNINDIKEEGVSPSRFLDVMAEERSAIKILVFDAWTPTTLGPSVKLAAAGLAFMKGPKGSFIAYAQSPGKANPPGSGYTKVLALSMVNLGEPIEEIFKKTAAIVGKESKRVPWTSSALNHSIRFTDKSTTQVSSDIEVCRDYALMGRNAMRAGHRALAIKHYQRLIKRCPSGRMAEHARKALESLGAY